MTLWHSNMAGKSRSDSSMIFPSGGGWIKTINNHQAAMTGTAEPLDKDLFLQ